MPCLFPVVVHDVPNSAQQTSLARRTGTTPTPPVLRMVTSTLLAFELRGRGHPMTPINVPFWCVASFACAMAPYIALRVVRETRPARAAGSPLPGPLLRRSAPPSFQGLTEVTDRYMMGRLQAHADTRGVALALVLKRELTPRARLCRPEGRRVLLSTEAGGQQRGGLAFSSSSVLLAAVATTVAVARFPKKTRCWTTVSFNFVLETSIFHALLAPLGG